MTWRDNALRIPTWPMITIQFAVGVMFLGLALYSVTANWDLIETHNDGLLLVGQAAVGGFGLGGAIEMLRRRLAAGGRNRSATTAIGAVLDGEAE